MESSRAPRASLVALALASLTGLAAACGSSFEGAPSDGSGGAGASGSNGAPSSNGSGGAGSGLPCDVAAVLATNCGECHTSPPKYGAPMPLADLDDLHAAAESDPITVAVTWPEDLGGSLSPERQAELRDYIVEVSTEAGVTGRFA